MNGQVEQTVQCGIELGVLFSSPNCDCFFQINNFAKLNAHPSEIARINVREGMCSQNSVLLEMLKNHIWKCIDVTKVCDIQFWSFRMCPRYQASQRQRNMNCLRDRWERIVWWLKVTVSVLRKDDIENWSWQ